MMEEAKTEFKKIIDSELYSLTPEISWNFDLEHEWNSESIFEVNFTLATNPVQSTSRASSIAPQEAGGGRSIEAAYNFIELCKRDPIDPSDPRNDGQTYSIRALATICLKEMARFYINGQPRHILLLWNKKPTSENSKTGHGQKNGQMEGLELMRK